MDNDPFDSLQALRELAIESEIYINSPKHTRSRVADRIRETTASLDSHASELYIGEEVVLAGIYQRAKYLRRSKSPVYFLDNKPITGTACGFTVIDKTTGFSDIESTHHDKPRQMDLLDTIGERSPIGKYLVCHLVTMERFSLAATDWTIAQTIICNAVGPINTCDLHVASDDILIPKEQRMEEIERVIASADPSVKRILLSIDLDLQHDDALHAISSCARKFRGISEMGNEALTRAVYDYIDKSLSDRYVYSSYDFQGEMPLSLMIDENNIAVPCRFGNTKSNKMHFTSLTMAPHYDVSKSTGQVSYDGSLALYAVGYKFTDDGMDDTVFLIPVEHLNGVDFCKTPPPGFEEYLTL